MPMVHKAGFAVRWFVDDIDHLSNRRIRSMGEILYSHLQPVVRKFVKSGDIPKVANGLGLAILSTSHGVMTDKQARKEGVGGELLCYIY